MLNLSSGLERLDYVDRTIKCGMTWNIGIKEISFKMSWSEPWEVIECQIYEWGLDLAWLDNWRVGGKFDLHLTQLMVTEAYRPLITLYIMEQLI